MYSSALWGSERVRTVVFLAALLLVAFVLRARNLGLLTLFGDEGVQALTLKGLVDSGLPIVESGRVHLRDALYLYLQYALLQIVDFTPFCLRLPSAVFGSLVIIPAYFLGKMLFNRNVGLMTALILTFSQFEIELSRYGRSYTLFQFLFVLSLIFFYQGFMLDKNRYKVFFVFGCLLAVASHSLGVVLFTLFLIPLLSRGHSLRRKLVFVLWASGTWLLKVQYGRWERYMRSLGDTDLGPVAKSVSEGETVVGKIGSVLGHHVYQPNLAYLGELIQHHAIYWWLLLLVTAGCSALLLSRMRIGEDKWKTLTLVIMVWCALVYQYSLVLTMLGLCVLFFVKDIRELISPSFRITFICVASIFIFWLVFIGKTPGAGLRETIALMFGVPRVSRYFFKWYVLGWPIMSFIVFLGAGVLLKKSITAGGDKAVVFVLGTLFFSVVTMSSFVAYPEARYTFHLYPLMVLLFAFSTVHVLQYVTGVYEARNGFYVKYLPVFAVVVALLASQDGNPVQAWKIASRGYTDPKHPIRTQENWPPYFRFHQDNEFPTRFVKERLKDGDVVVALGGLHHLGLYQWYGGKVHYYAPPAHLDYYSVLRNGAEINYITGSKVIRGPDMFDDLLLNAPGAVWVLGDKSILANGSYGFYREPDRKYFNSIIKQLDFVGRDNMTFAAKLK
jgi:hypothetical protein